MTIEKLKESLRSRFWWQLRKWHYGRYMHADRKYILALKRDIDDKKQKATQDCS